MHIVFVLNFLIGVCACEEFACSKIAASGGRCAWDGDYRISGVNSHKIKLFHRQIDFYDDITVFPDFRVLTSTLLASWARPPSRSLDPNKRDFEQQVMFGHHMSAVEHGLAMRGPYVSNEMFGSEAFCWSSGPVEKQFVGELENVWILSNGVMLTRSNALISQHHELHVLTHKENDAVHSLRSFRNNVTVVNLRQQWSHNYFHAVLEVLPRLSFIIEQGLLKRTKSYKILVGNLPPAVYDYLDLIGISKSDLEIESEKDNIAMWCDKVIFSSYSPYRFPSEVPCESVQAMRRMVLNGAVAKNILDRRKLSIENRTVVIAMREESDTREIAWQEKVAAIKNSPIGRKWNVVVVRAAKLSGIEQIKAYADAAVVIGTHGSNLVNLIWMRYPAAVVEVFPPVSFGPQFSFYWHYSSVCRFDHYSVFANENFEISIHVLVATVEAALNGVQQKYQ